MTSFTSGLPSRETCTKGPAETWLALSASSHLRLLATGRRPDPDGRKRVCRVCRVHPVGGEELGRNLNRDGVHVHVLGGVDSRSGLGQTREIQAESVVQLLERPQVAEVEDRSEVHIEPFGALARKDLYSSVQFVHGRVGQVHVIVGRERADPARRAREAARDLPRWSVFTYVNREELALVPVRRVEGLDRSRVVQERVRVVQDALELELERDVRVRVAIVVDVDLVEDVVTELVEVGTTVGCLEAGCSSRSG